MNSIEKEAKQYANKRRNDLGLGIEPVPDLFDLVENLGILLIQKKLGRNSLSGLFLNYKNVQLFLVNTAKTLGHQNFTIAHELYHYFYDKDITNSICNTFKFKNQKSISEKKADYFAVHFLMPENGITNFFNKILQEKEIGFKEIIKAQNHFKVSYQAILVRLLVLDYISKDKYEELKGEYLTPKFKKMGYELDLIQPTNIERIPKKYIEYLTGNYENQKISKKAFIKYLEDIGKNPEEVGFNDKNGGDDHFVEETSFDY